MTRLGVFSKTVDEPLNTKAEGLMEKGRLTIVEASLFNAIDLSESDPGEAKDMVDDVVKSMNSNVKAADGKEVKKASIKSSDIHKVLWQAATKVMKGEAP